MASAPRARRVLVPWPSIHQTAVCASCADRSSSSRFSDCQGSTRTPAGRSGFDPARRPNTEPALPVINKNHALIMTPHQPFRLGLAVLCTVCVHSAASSSGRFRSVWNWQRFARYRVHSAASSAGRVVPLGNWQRFARYRVHSAASSRRFGGSVVGDVQAHEQASSQGSPMRRRTTDASPTPAATAKGLSGRPVRPAGHGARNGAIRIRWAAHSGKTSLHNALAGGDGVAARHAFSTKSANVGVARVPDARLPQLAAMSDSRRTVHASVQFTDIGGLRGRARTGASGLGNAFLGHIRDTDAIVYVLRAFTDPDITGDDDPLNSLRVLETELALADLDSAARQLDKLARAAKGDPSLRAGRDLLARTVGVLRRRGAAVPGRLRRRHQDRSSPVLPDHEQAGARGGEHRGGPDSGRRGPSGAGAGRAGRGRWSWLFACS